MNNQPRKKFSWCPVCMIHTYYVWNNREWKCVNEDHDMLLRLRKDPWIQEYRQRHSELLSVSQDAS